DLIRRRRTLAQLPGKLTRAEQGQTIDTNWPNAHLGDLEEPPGQILEEAKAIAKKALLFFFQSPVFGPKTTFEPEKIRSHHNRLNSTSMVR
ncbi:MAG: hypothetical protein ACYS74_21050, partial [Planctomycetota bacterium]